MYQIYLIRMKEKKLMKKNEQSIQYLRVNKKKA